MIKLLTADFRRIMKKRSFWAVLILTLLLTVVFALDGINAAPQKGLKLTSSILNMTSEAELLFGLLILLSVFGDEFRSMTMISVIGRGLSRWKFILAKFLDTVFLLGQLFFLFGACVMLVQRVMGVSLLPIEQRAVLVTILASFCSAVGVVTLSALFLYLTGSVPFAVFMYLTLCVIIPVAIVFANMVPSVERFHLDRWYLYGFCARASADLVYGSTAGGILTLAMGIVLYIFTALGLTWLVFRKKELEF